MLDNQLIKVISYTISLVSYPVNQFNIFLTVFAFSELHLLDLCNTLFVARTLGERSIQPGIYDLQSQTTGRYSGAQSQDVGIVVLSGSLCTKAVTTQCAADALDAVSSDGDTDTGTTDQNTLLTLAGQYGVSY